VADGPPGRGYWTPGKTFIRYWTRLHIRAYRLSRGRVLYRMRGMPTLLLTTTGRKSGQLHTVALPYFADGPDPVVVGSYAGAERDPAWVLNLRTDPAVEVQDRGDVRRARAVILEGEERAAVWQRLIGRHSWYADYQTRTSREIPLVRLVRSP